MIENFQQLLSQFHQNQHPANQGELHTQLNQLAELLDLGEKIVVYLATQKELTDDMITCVFEYKQLIKLDEQLQQLRYTLPATPVQEPTTKPKSWWKIWGN